MRRATRWLLVVLIPVGVFLVALGVAGATDSPAPFALVLVVTASLSIGYPSVALGRLGWRLLRGRPLFPVVRETGVMVWLMSLLATVLVAPPATRVTSRARLAKAQADTHKLASAIHFYREHTARLPETLDDLTRPVANAKGEAAGPFLGAIPPPPAGWAPYRYER